MPSARRIGRETRTVWALQEPRRAKCRNGIRAGSIFACHSRGSRASKYATRNFDGDSAPARARRTRPRAHSIYEENGQLRTISHSANFTKRGSTVAAELSRRGLDRDRLFRLMLPTCAEFFWTFRGPFCCRGISRAYLSAVPRGPHCGICKRQSKSSCATRKRAF